MATPFIDTMLAAQQYNAGQQGIEANQLKLDAAKQQMQQAPMANALAARVLGGDQSALGQLVQLNPELAQTVGELGLKLGNDARTQLENRQKYMTTYLTALRALPNPQERMAAHAQMVGSPFSAAVLGPQLTQQLRSMGPEGFSDAGLDRSLVGLGAQPPHPEYDIKEGVDGNGRRVFAYVPKTPQPNAGPVQTVAGVAPEDPAAKAPKVTNNLQMPAVTVDPKTGQVTIGVTPSTRSKVEGDVLDTQGVMSSLSSITSGFKPEYQTIGTRLGMGWKALKAAFSNNALSQSDAQELQDFATYRADAAQNLSAIIKQLAGSAVSDGEAARILSFIPNAGTGVFDGDDPVTFKSKMDAAVRRTKLALARQQYALAHGITLDQLPTQIPLESMPGVMSQRFAQLQTEAQQHGLTGAAAKRFVANGMKQAFGVGGQ
jgi:hypothetical protein